MGIISAVVWVVCEKQVIWIRKRNAVVIVYKRLSLNVAQEPDRGASGWRGRAFQREASGIGKKRLPLS